MQELRSYLELLYFLSNIVVAVGVVFGLQQIALLKRDMRLRNERAAKEKAIEYGSRYLTRFTTLINMLFDECKAAKLQSYKGSVGDLTQASLTKEAASYGDVVNRYQLQSWLPAFNELETIAAAFTSGVADEQTGFRNFGLSFCSTVKANYDLIAFSRRADSANNYWDNIVQLYKVWSPRLNEAQLRGIKDMIERQIAEGLNGGKLPVIGVE